MRVLRHAFSKLTLISTRQHSKHKATRLLHILANCRWNPFKVLVSWRHAAASLAQLTRALQTLQTRMHVTSCRVSSRAVISAWVEFTFDVLRLRQIESSAVQKWEQATTRHAFAGWEDGVYEHARVLKANTGCTCIRRWQAVETRVAIGFGKLLRLVCVSWQVHVILTRKERLAVKRFGWHLMCACCTEWRLQSVETRRTKLGCRFNIEHDFSFS